ncbi:MAG TPA: ComEA family DNA-binding protein [Acidimicrobiia bacterium]
MSDTLAPSVPSPPGPRDHPDPEFWGPSHPSRERGLRRPASTGVLDRALDRLHAWRTDPRMGVGALVVVALVAGFVWYRVGMASGGAGPGPAAEATEVPAGGSDPVADPAAGGDPTRADPTGDPTGTDPGAAGRVTVHVAGAVLRPGVVELGAGARVIDGIEAAGGGLPEADLDRLNLAAPLGDGQRVLVQRIGDPPAPADPGSAGGGSAGAGDPGATNQPVNLNTATTEQLETLPGIGPVLAEAIVAERDRRGGFRSVNELRDVRGIGDQRFADLEGLVTV